MKHIITIGFLLFVFSGFSQVTFIIESLPADTPEEDFIYIAGSFNSWDPGQEEFRLLKNEDNNWQIRLNEQVEGSMIAFKFTRGDWGSVEKDANGNEMANRTFTFGNGETVSIEIARWADSGGGNSTAAENVRILDEEFYMPQLNKYRRIWIYLPPDYEQSTITYPVLYMHDGQNLFDTKTAFAGEWEVDETLNQLFVEGKNVPIVVGIDNGGSERLDEYSPWVNLQFGGGNGEAYIDFIVETLKPYIDTNYRSRADAYHTGIMGSSMGGFISHYALFKHSNVFTKGGLFSPSYWFSDSVWAFISDNGHFHNQKVYQLMGGEEGYFSIAMMDDMNNLLLDQGFSNDNLVSKVVAGQGHNEAFWRSEFGEAYLWLFSDFASSTNDQLAKEEPWIHPNPVQDILYLKNTNIDSISIFDSKGNLVLEKQKPMVSQINVQSLKSGLYLVKLWIDGDEKAERFIKK